MDKASIEVTHLRLPVSGPLREEVDLDGDAAGVDEGTAVLVMVKGSWGQDFEALTGRR